MLVCVLFQKVCSKVCSFAKLTFGLVEVTNRTKGQFQQFQTQLILTKPRQKNTLLNTLLERTHKQAQKQTCVLSNTHSFFFVNSLLIYCFIEKISDWTHKTVFTVNKYLDLPHPPPCHFHPCRRKGGAGGASASGVLGALLARKLCKTWGIKTPF